MDVILVLSLYYYNTIERLVQLFVDNRFVVEKIDDSITDTVTVLITKWLL